MDLRNRLYPYPVLYKYNDNYIDSEFDILIESKKSKTEIEFSFEVVINNDGLMNYIKNGDAEFVVHIECSSTCYRNIVRFSSQISKIIIDENKLNDVVEFCSFIIAKKDIYNYFNEYFNEVYKNLTFEIEKYNVLAIGSQINFSIEKDYDSLKNIKSIFAIIRDDSIKDYICTDLSGDIICIYVPVRQFNIYKNIGNLPYNIPIIHSMLIVPTLVEIFEGLKNNYDLWEEYEDKRWFKALKNAFTKKDIDFNKENFENFDSIKNAQLIIDSPIISSFNNMSSLCLSEEDEL